MAEVATEKAVAGVITYPEDLPVAARREEIAAAIAEHQVVIVAGETGSGKTTQLPKICLELGRGVKGVIGHTQPRRLAARTVAQRIAQELSVELGSVVGYAVRFTDRVSDDTAVKLMTDGILLAEIQRDRLLNRYDTIIIDEAHERSLNIDFLLGYLKRLLPQRPDLKLIITSATIDLESFSRHFDDAPVIEVSGRGYPVTTHYLDAVGEEEGERVSQIRSLVEKIDAGAHGERGDVLVFLPGERDIRELARVLRDSTSLEVLPLYARLGQAEQNRVFNVSGRRGTRVVLATNVAETSLTVPGIRYVIDLGDARISRYSARTQLQRLPIEPISQASANQRQGRCGRVGPGVCFRLYSEEDFASRPAFTDPEIQRTNLAAVVLSMLSLNLGKVESFPFIDPPDSRMVRDGYRLLEELGAVSAQGKLTKVGRRLARLPVDPRLGRMVLAATREGCLAEVLVIASALAVQDPRERPTGKQTQADQSHARFRHPRSEFLAWLNLWRYYEEQRQALSQNQLRKLCKRDYLSYLRMREWRDIHMQLSIAVRRMDLRPGNLPQETADDAYGPIHRALLSGLLGNVAQWHEGRDYLGARNRKLQVFPGSSLAKKSPKWLVAGEVVETSKVFARQVAAIEPSWLLEVNPHLLKRHCYSPRWNSRRGQVLAYERVTLYGLTIADKRTVNYGQVEPVESRELFIREALVAGNYRRHPPFLKHNQRLVRDVEALEARVRRRDILVDEDALYAFYDARVPAEINSANHLEAWLKREPGAEQSLRMDRETLMLRDPSEEIGGLFPDSLQWQDMTLALRYQFEPGKEADGVSVTVPVGLLNRVPRYLFDWLVPGLLREKCIALVRALPKDKRKRLVPVPDWVDRALADMSPRDEDLLAVLAERLSSLGDVRLTRHDFDARALDDYYRMNVRVVDASGKLLGQGRALEELVQAFSDDTRQSMAGAGEDSPARSGLTAWNFGELGTEHRSRQAGVDIVSFPALVDQGDSVAIELCDYPWQAKQAHRLGLLRLAMLGQAQQLKYLRKQLLRGNDWALALAGAGMERESLVEDAIAGAFMRAMDFSHTDVRDEDAFSRHVRAGAGDVVSAANDIEQVLFSSMQLLAEIRQLIARCGKDKYPDTLADVDTQLQGLTATHVIRDTDARWFAQWPRYFKALKHRMERLSGQYAKDQKYTAMLAQLIQPLSEAQASRPGLLLASDVAADYRWSLEEFRVSLFAQQLGTRQAVSEKRLRAKWQDVEAWLEANR
ncbi:MAG: ATP-dependent RNA helicase HrpA [Halioglobus sp.]